MEGPVKKIGFSLTGGFGKKQLEEQVEALRTLNAGMEQKLKDEQARLHQYKQHNKKRLESLETTRSILREENSTLTGKDREHSEKLAQLSKENDKLVLDLLDLKEHLEASRQDALSSKHQIEVLNAAKDEMQQKVSDQGTEIFELGEDNKSIEKRRLYLEGVAAWYSNRYPQLNSGAYDDYEAETAAKNEMVQKLEMEKAMKVELRTKVEALEAEKEDLAAESRTRMEALEAEKESTTAKLLARIGALEIENEACNQTCAELRACESVARKNTPQTLRSLLIMKWLEMKFPLSATDDYMEPEVPFIGPALSAGDELDKVYSPTEADRIAEILHPWSALKPFYAQLKLKTCKLCSKPRIRGNVQSTTLIWFNEFPCQGSFFSCCGTKVCRQCFVDYLVKAVQHGWWHKLGSLQWLACPTAGCERALEIRCEANFELCLERNKAPNVEEHVKM
jgi:hypothetical protein